MEAENKVNSMSFRPDFAWGVATSAYQIEGAYNTVSLGLACGVTL